eukprot:SAG31_NODE_2336_length_5921_cov_33.442288_4_plen_176_part_00
MDTKAGRKTIADMIEFIGNSMRPCSCPRRVPFPVFFLLEMSHSFQQTEPEEDGPASVPMEPVLTKNQVVLGQAKKRSAVMKLPPNTGKRKPVPIRYEASGRTEVEKMTAPGHVLLIDEVVTGLYLLGLFRLPKIFASMFNTQVHQIPLIAAAAQPDIYRFAAGRDTGAKQCAVQG